MEVINFAGDVKGSASVIDERSWAIWKAEKMELVSNETHVEALKTGEAYLMVWPDATGRPRAVGGSRVGRKGSAAFPPRLSPAAACARRPTSRG